MQSLRQLRYGVGTLTQLVDVIASVVLCDSYWDGSTQSVQLYHNQRIGTHGVLANELGRGGYQVAPRIFAELLEQDGVFPRALQSANQAKACQSLVLCYLNI